MKKILICFISICTTFSSYAQWSTSGGLLSSTNTTGGNVGIGTNSPAVKLHINASSDDVTGLRLNTGGFSMGGQAQFQIDAPGVVGGRINVGSNGNVGIGTANPSSKLHVLGNVQINENSQLLTFGNMNWQSAPALGYVTGYLGFNLFNNAQGTWDLATDGANSGGTAIYSDIFGQMKFATVGSSGTSQTLSNTQINNAVSFQIGPGYVWVPGRIQVGQTGTPTGYKLSVDGKIISEEITVKIKENWPDYVFEKEYNLLPLDSIKTFIHQNKHLPEVPSAKEMEANGVNLGEMNMLLLKKVEELTLYIIEQNKNDQIQREQIKNLISEVNKLKQK